MPVGFQGLGVHNATMLYYLAFTQTFTQFMDLPAAALDLQAAANLYFGGGSTTSKAVTNALAAVNMSYPAYLFTSGQRHQTPATALVLPASENGGTYLGTFAAGTTSEYYQATCPPGATLSVTTGGQRMPASTTEDQAPWLQILDSSGANVLALAAAELLGPGPTPSGWQYSGAGLDWTNSTGSAQTYLIRVYSPATRPALYTCMTRLRLNILSFTTYDSQAMAW